MSPSMRDRGPMIGTFKGIIDFYIRIDHNLIKVHLSGQLYSYLKVGVDPGILSHLGHC